MRGNVRISLIDPEAEIEKYNAVNNSFNRTFLGLLVGCSAAATGCTIGSTETTSSGTVTASSTTSDDTTTTSTGSSTGEPTGTGTETSGTTTGTTGSPTTGSTGTTGTTTGTTTGSPISMCGWDPGNNYYECGFEGEDPSGTIPIACPDGLVEGDPCGNVPGEGCCDANGDLWYCGDNGMGDTSLVFTSCE